MIRVACSLVALGVVAFAVPLAESAEIGQPAPTFTGINTAGETVALEDLRGQTVVLEWSNDGCPYVQKHYGTGNMQALQREAVDEHGAVWLTVISSAPGTQGYVEPMEADALTEDRDAAPSHVLLDPQGEIGRMYDARVTPHMYVIDGDGTLVYAGGIDDKPSANWATVEGATNYVSAALDDMAAGKPVATPSARAYGCSVKYAPGA
ncbi:MAG: redoxin domain-containing protein [Geminicoccaceae bacterium]